MTAIYPFLFKSILVSGILMGWYMLALRGKRMYNYNRFFLLFTLYASVQVPLLHLQWFSVSPTGVAASAPAALLLQAADVSVPPSPDAQLAHAVMNWDNVALYAVASISLFLAGMLLWRVMNILIIAARYPRSVHEGIMVVRTDLEKAPFSFMRLLFWRNDIDINSAKGRLIFQHEQAHIRQAHTIDKLLSGLLTATFWMNPFFWLIQKELSLVHEFIADSKAIADNDTDAFARMLLPGNISNHMLTPEHQFFSSPIKKRLTMLQTSAKTSYAFFRKAMILPLIAVSVLLFSFTVRTTSGVTEARAAGKIVLVLDAGHGGNDAGATYGDLKEKDLNLRIARRLAELAPSYNIDAHLTRGNDDYITLENRVTYTNQLSPDYFISIHVDSRKGNEISKGSFAIAINSANRNAAKSSSLAYAVYKRIARPEWDNQVPVSEKSIYVLRDNPVPAILIEFGDIKNKQQMDLLTDGNKLDDICRSLLQGVVEAHKG